MGMEGSGLSGGTTMSEPEPFTTPQATAFRALRLGVRFPFPMGPVLTYKNSTQHAPSAARLRI
jgi:hypothetical protein